MTAIHEATPHARNRSLILIIHKDKHNVWYMISLWPFCSERGTTRETWQPSHSHDNYNCMEEASVKMGLRQGHGLDSAVNKFRWTTDCVFASIILQSTPVN